MDCLLILRGLVFGLCLVGVLVQVLGRLVDVLNGFIDDIGGLIRRGGVSSSASSLPAARMLVSFFSLIGFTSRSFSRECSPRIMPS